MQIEISETELALLGDVLEQTYVDLKEEIYKTETAAYQHELKEREAVLVGLLHKVGRTDTAPLH